MATKNLGQVAGIAIQNTPPLNTTLIWFDSTPSQMCHKVYDPATEQWSIIAQNVISSITYSELVNIASKTGLTLGKFYQITDRGNTLAVAISSTKVQYNDLLGNILIDDLGTNIQYHVTSSNLQIDGVAGTFGNNKLVFSFDEMENDLDADYILGKTKRSDGVWKLFKFKLKNLISSANGNSISWKNGLFISVMDIVNGLKDKLGGFVSMEKFNTTVAVQNTAINNIGKENQSIIQSASNLINIATSDSAIYNKVAPNVETGGEPIDAKKGDTLITIISKFQKWINRFKYANGIKVSKDFAPSPEAGIITNNDDVDTALRKTQYYLDILRTYHDSDKPLISTYLNNNEYDESVKDAITAQIISGELSIFNNNWINAEWYTGGSDEAAIYSFKFFPMNFDDEVIELVKARINVLGQLASLASPLQLSVPTIAYFNAYRNEGDSYWEYVQNNIKLYSCLAFYRNKLGISLHPLTVNEDIGERRKIANSSTKLSDFINDEFTDQSSYPEKYIQISIPPFTYNFKLK